MTVPHHPFRFGVQAGDLMTRGRLLDTARLAEQLGYSVFSYSDHLHHSTPQLAPMIALATVAAVTTSIELQPMVLANDLHHPAVLAKEAATLDLLCDGRFSLALGAGWLAPDFHSSGMEFRRPHIRIERVAEAIEVIRGLHSGEPFNYQGKHYRITNLIGTPVPARAPMPLLVAGSGRALLSLAATTADTIGLNPGLPFGAGDWRKGSSPYADVTDSKLEWIRNAAGERLDKLEIQTSILAGGITAGDPREPLAPVAAMLGVPVEQLLGCPHVLAGTVEDCIATIKQWRQRWGISYISFPSSIAHEMAPVVSALRGK